MLHRNHRHNDAHANIAECGNVADLCQFTLVNGRRFMRGMTALLNTKAISKSLDAEICEALDGFFFNTCWDPQGGKFADAVMDLICRHREYTPHGSVGAPEGPRESGVNTNIINKPATLAGIDSA